MGMYTELVIKCNIIKELPQDVNAILNYLFCCGDDPPQNLPKHEFFNCRDWHCIGRSNSYYHIPACCNYFDRGYLFSRSDTKNYGNQIYLFLDWIDPYIYEEEGKFIGWIWYEEWDEPKFIYKKT